MPPFSNAGMASNSRPIDCGETNSSDLPIPSSGNVPLLVQTGEACGVDRTLVK